SDDLEDKMLAGEIGAASGEKELIGVAKDAAKQVILKMTRAEAGGLAPRLALLTGEREIYRPWEWQQWLIKIGRRFEVRPAWAIDLDGPTPPLAHLGPLGLGRVPAL